MPHLIYGYRNAALFFNTTINTIRWIKEIGLIHPKKIIIAGTCFNALDEKDQKAIKKYLKVVD